MKDIGAMTGKPVSSRGRGEEGERSAALYLSGRGYKLLATNFRSRFGEIDIIAEKDDTVAFVEVKSWKALGEADLEFSIGRTKQRRIVHTARLFLSRQPQLTGKRLRFDVIFLGGRDSRSGVRHIENAFGGAVQ